jgi:hypothetical protein
MSAHIRFITLGLVLWAGLSAAAETPAVREPPKYVGPPLPLQAVTNRAFQGIPSMAVTPGGRLWTTWYAGVTPGEDHNNYVVLSTSGDNGKSWKEVLVVDPDADGPRRAFDPELWMTPEGKLRWSWSDRVGGDSKTDELWMIELTDPEAENSPRSKPSRLAAGVMMCKPLVLTTGEWVMPVCTWFTEQSSKMIVSTDSGKTWSLRGGATLPKQDRLFDEHMFVERKDGSIWLLSRTKYGIGESVSTDRGKTWPDLQPSKLQHPSARFFIRRLSSGSLLLVKHGPLDKKTGRSHLTAFVSTDDGKTWGGGLLLDERSGVSYPDGQQDADGLIRIIYDYSRTGTRHILMAAFREEDVAAGKDVSGSVKLRQLVSEASGGREKKPEPVQANADGEPLRQGAPGSLQSERYRAQPLRVGAELFTDRTYTLAELPDALRDARFLKVTIEGGKTLTCDRAGAVLFLTPAPGRNKDSQSETLTKQGFRKVALSEVRLFDPKNPANYCTLYQKDCRKGETIEFGKWAVPVLLDSSNAKS